MAASPPRVLLTIWSLSVWQTQTHGTNLHRCSKFPAPFTESSAPPPGAQILPRSLGLNTVTDCMVGQTYWCKPFLWLFRCCQRILKTRTRRESQSINDTRLWFPQFYDVKTWRIWEHCFWKLVFLFGIFILLLTNLWIDSSDYMSIKGHFKREYIHICVHVYMCVYVCI